jgi:hypothetical protein
MIGIISHIALSYHCHDVDTLQADTSSVSLTQTYDKRIQKKAASDKYP